MNLHEYQVGRLFAYYDLPVPMGYACTTPCEAEEAASKIGAGPWVVKCRAHAGGRGKAGSMKVVNSKEDICAFAEHRLGRRLVTYRIDTHGQPINQILVEATTDIGEGLYLGTVIDHSSRRVVFVAFIGGDVGIEKVAEETPHLTHKVALDPLTGPMPYQGRELAFKLGLEGKQVQQFAKIFTGLATIFLERNLALIEINSLVVTKRSNLTCLNGKLGADDNALFRQANLREMRDQSQEDPREAQVIQWELSYVALDGNIGCMVNGAGLAMDTMDIAKLHSGESVNFLDVGGGATKEHVTEASEIILSDDSVKAVLISILDGIARCDLVADDITDAVAEVGVNVPVVVRLEGNNTKLGAKGLADNGLNIIATKSLTDTIQQVVAAVEEE